MRNKSKARNDLIRGGVSKRYVGRETKSAQNISTIAHSRSATRALYTNPCDKPASIARFKITAPPMLFGLSQRRGLLRHVFHQVPHPCRTDE